MARDLLRRERNAQTLQKTTALILTAFRRQKPSDKDWNEVNWADREEFMSHMYIAMDRALIDKAREQKTLRARLRIEIEDQQIDQWLGEQSNRDKALYETNPEQLASLAEELRAREVFKVFFTDELQLKDLRILTEQSPEITLAINSALKEFEKRDNIKATMLKHQVYGGLSLKEIATFMEIPYGTVRRYLREAKLNLYALVLEQLKNKGTKK